MRVINELHDRKASTDEPRTCRPITPLAPHLADRLLDLLATDDSFRDLFQTSPQAALHCIGYQAPSSVEALDPYASEPFALCEIGELASKQAIRSARATLKDALVQGLAYHTPTLDAGVLHGIKLR